MMRCGNAQASGAAWRRRPALAGVLVLAGCYNDAADYRRLVDHHASAPARVVYAHCGERVPVVLAFRDPAGREHRLKPPPGRPGCEAKVGDEVQVFYDPDHPDTSTALPPSEAYAEAHGWYVPEVAWVVGFSLFVLVAGIARFGLSGRRARGQG